MPMLPISRRSIKKDSLRIECLVVPPLSNNTYIVYEDGDSEALVIDVALGAEALGSRLRELELKAKMIINTHGHTDHTAEDQQLKTKTGAPIAIHELDAYRLAAEDEASSQLEIRKFPLEADLQLITGQELRFGKGCALRVLHTPGHTEGSICLYDSKRGQLFSGDTLFAGGYGRVDGQGADPASMLNSLSALMQLPDSTEIYPGHGPFTTIQNEREWVKELQAEPKD